MPFKIHILDQQLNVLFLRIWIFNSHFLENLCSKPSRMLYFCHSTRTDIIIGFIEEYQRKKTAEESFEAALIVCSCKSKYALSKEIYKRLQGLDVPIMHAPVSTYHAMEMLLNLTPKLNAKDQNRVTSTATHYEKYIDFDLLLRRITRKNTSSSRHSKIQS